MKTSWVRYKIIYEAGGQSTRSANGWFWWEFWWWEDTDDMASLEWP